MFTRAAASAPRSTDDETGTLLIFDTDRTSFNTPDAGEHLIIDDEYLNSGSDNGGELSNEGWKSEGTDVRERSLRRNAIAGYGATHEDHSKMKDESGGGISKNSKIEKDYSMDHCSDGKLSVMDAILAVLNFWLGSIMLTYPYAVAQGGLISLPILGLVCLSAAHAGKLIARCMDSDLVIQADYPGVAWHAWEAQFGAGWIGRCLVSLSIAMQFAGIVVANVIFILRNIATLLPRGIVECWQIALIVCISALPASLSLDIQEQSLLNLIGTLSHLSSIVLIIGLCLYVEFNDLDHHISDNDHSPSLNHEPKSVDIWPDSAHALSVSTGLYIFCLSGHPFFPEVYKKMREPRKFGVVMDVCSTIMFAFCAMIGTLGYQLFGRDGTSPVITESFSMLIDQIGHRAGVLNLVCQLLVGSITLGCFTTVIPTLSVICDIPEQLFHIQDESHQRRMIRVGGLIACVLCGYVLIHHVEYVYALSGSMFIMVTSVISPPLFYIILCREEDRRQLKADWMNENDENDIMKGGLLLTKKKKMNWIQLGYYCFLIVFGFLFGVILVYNDVHGLIIHG